MSLHFRLFDAAQAPADAGRVLGGALLGAPAVAVDWPEQAIFAPLPGSTAATLREAWLVESDCVAGRDDGIVWRRHGDLLYGVLTLDEADFAGTAVPPLQAATDTAYRRIFGLLDACGLPHLWRVWNYLADINGETHGLERYRQFNIGRQEAYAACRRDATDGSAPAACAIGLAGGPLSIAFLAAAQPAQAIENPRQVSAYHYPADYGPRSPTFSRGALARTDGRELLFVSGTASIVGHRTVHAGDAAEQTREAMRNIAVVVDEANRLAARPFALPAADYRVYLRHAADYAAVRAALAETPGIAEAAVFVQADICRSDLLVEIEALAAHVRVDD